MPLPRNVSVENLLKAHLRRITVALVGYPPGSLPSPLPKSPTPVHPNGLESSSFPAQQSPSLPPSHAPGPVKVNCKVLPQQTLSFPDTRVQHYSGVCVCVCWIHASAMSWYLACKPIIIQSANFRHMKVHCTVYMLRPDSQPSPFRSQLASFEMGRPDLQLL